MTSVAPPPRPCVLAAVAALLLATAGCLSPLGSPDAGASPGRSVPTATPHPSTAPTATATVVEVVDGDTVKVRYPNGSRDTVRLVGVDTPEVHVRDDPTEYEGVPDTERGRRCLRGHGDRASDYATERLDGETVELGFDENEGRRGYYGRLLAYVYVGGEQFNYRLVREGYARAYDSGFVERERYEAAEADARADGRGLWSCATAGGGSDQRPAGEGGLAIETVHADAEGNDNENLGDEYVVLANRGDRTLSLDGWTVEDEAGHRYAFPAGTTLRPGESLTLRTGSGEDARTDYYWGRERAVWNNDGDAVSVRDAAGGLVARRTYGSAASVGGTGVERVTPESLTHAQSAKFLWSK
ncbi:lamin tail domain-containing protein [Halegenticoccus soli]|uniref:lamin tail domain-containing protein n=1 Tax=Halegenticoccus soli TaxID=1985678 RepID=UPI001E5624A3|nr:lamin tail domain-containing protein [Halegenticoccus soli]